ncbi:MAG: FecR family protein [Alphaproteobacteria bacterium]
MIRFNCSLRMAGLVLSLPLFLMQAPSLAYAADAVGKIRMMRMVGYGSLPGETTKKTLYQNDPVYSGQTIETVANGAMVIVFADGTEFRLGPKSSVTLDKYIYDPASHDGALNMTLTQGLFTFITGKIHKEAVELKTPLSTIGIRGTNFGVMAGPGVPSVIQVFSGQIAIQQYKANDLTSANGNTPKIPAVIVSTGEVITIKAPTASRTCTCAQGGKTILLRSSPLCRPQRQYRRAGDTCCSRSWHLGGTRT